MLALPTPFNPSPSSCFSLSHPFSVLFAISVSRRAPAKSATDLSPSQFAPTPFNLRLSTVNSASSKSHRITFFAHPLHLTLIESHSYKKQGEGWVPRDVQNPAHSLPLFSTASKHHAHRNAHNSFSFHPLTSRFSGYAGYTTPPAPHPPLFSASPLRPLRLCVILFRCSRPDPSATSLSPYFASLLLCPVLPCPPLSGATHA